MTIKSQQKRLPEKLSRLPESMELSSQKIFRSPVLSDKSINEDRWVAAAVVQ